MSAIVAVSSPRRTDGGRERVALNSVYVRALVRAGLVPIVVPPIVEPLATGAVLDHVRGLVLTGGDDVDPARYRAPRHPNLGRTDAERDAVELALFAGATERRLPVLAICRGIQLVNVALGGTLYQDLPSERPSDINHADERTRHGLSAEAGSLAHRAVGALTASVNTRHHQAIRDLAPGLRPTAWATDGVIEAVEWATGPGGWMLAVQWHPEEEIETALFRGFAEAIG